MSGEILKSGQTSAARLMDPPFVAPSSLRCFATITAVKLSLSILGFSRTRRMVRRMTGRFAARTGECSSRSASATAARVAGAAALFPGRALCLEQSLALYVLLRRGGIQATLRLGVQAYPFAAHAWVEHAGEAINEVGERLKQFSALPDFMELQR